MYPLTSKRPHEICNQENNGQWQLIRANPLNLSLRPPFFWLVSEPSSLFYALPCFTVLSIFFLPSWTQHPLAQGLLCSPSHWMSPSSNPLSLNSVSFTIREGYLACPHITNFYLSVSTGFTYGLDVGLGARERLRITPKILDLSIWKNRVGFY